MNKKKKFDFRKKTKVTIELSYKALCGLEDALYHVPLCEKHKKEDNEIKQIESQYLSCKKCNKVREQWFSIAKGVDFKLWKAFYKKAGWDWDKPEPKKRTKVSKERLIEFNKRINEPKTKK